MQVPIANSKIDISFANSLNTLKNNTIIQIVLHSIQFITMVVMIPIEIYVYKHNNQSVLSFFITATCITFMNMSAKLGHLFCSLKDGVNIMSIATQLNHVVVEQQASQRIGQAESNGQVVISQKVYNVQNNTTIQEATPLVRKTLQPALVNMIRTIALSHDPLNKCAINIGSVSSFGLFIYGIVILATVQQMETSQIAVMSTFLVSEFIIQINIYLCLLFIAILPLLCLILCFYSCFCKQGSKRAKLPQPIPATIQIIQKSDGEPCSICFQNIMLNQQVIVVQCPGQHTFHQNCITTWTTVKPNCPNCRHDLTQ